MKERNLDEMIAYFNRRVSEMDIAQDYKMELLGMVTALGYKHEKTAQPERIGWICPVCGRGLSPLTMVCPCQNGKGWEITCKT